VKFAAKNKKGARIDSVNSAPAARMGGTHSAARKG